MALPRAITNELLPCGQTHSEPTRRSPRSGTAGPAVARAGTIQMNWVSSAYCPERDQFSFRRPESTVLRACVGHQPKAMKDPTAARGARAQGADGVHSASWGNPRCGGRAGGRLKPEIRVTIGGDRLPRLGDVTFKNLREFLVTYLQFSSRCISQQPRWRRPGTREEARTGRFGDPNGGG